MQMRTLAGLTATLLVTAVIADTRLNAATEVTDLSNGEPVGTIGFKDSDYGLIVVPELSGLSPGLHAVHIHEYPDCGADQNGTPAGRAGDHLDPEDTGHHQGPYGDGHLGDLPNITVEADGTASVPVLAPRVTVADIVGRAVVLHAGADRYHDHAIHDHGKGGARMYCGVIR